MHAGVVVGHDEVDSHGGAANEMVGHAGVCEGSHMVEGVVDDDHNNDKDRLQGNKHVHGDAL